VFDSGPDGTVGTGDDIAVKRIELQRYGGGVQFDSGPSGEAVLTGLSASRAIFTPDGNIVSSGAIRLANSRNTTYRINFARPAQSALLNGRGVEIKNHKQSGYTLVELIVVGMMFSILTIAAYNLFDNQSKINRTQQNYVEMQSSARAAMQILIKDFSHAGFGCVDSFNVGRTLNVQQHFSHSINRDISSTWINTRRL
jgi:hypothetical protein